MRTMTQAAEEHNGTRKSSRIKKKSKLDYNTSPQYGKPCFLVGCHLESQSGSQEKRKLSELELDKKPVDSGSKQGDYQVPPDSYSLYLAWLPIIPLV